MQSAESREERAESREQRAESRVSAIWHVHLAGIASGGQGNEPAGRYCDTLAA